MPKPEVRPIVKDDAHRDLIKRVSFQPVFIMGLHRSGTTFLYNLLARTGQFNVVTAYHIIRYAEIVDNHLKGRVEQAKAELADQFRSLGITNRVIDGVMVSPDSPAEYGFAIDSRMRASLTPETLPKFMELCRKIQVAGDPQRPLLLKNPWDVTRFLYVKECFPDCRFIFLHRHPLSVLHSQVQAIRSIRDAGNPYLALMLKSYGEMLRHPWRRALANVLTSELLGAPRRIAGVRTLRGVEYLLKNVSEIPESQRITVRYEDLCADPDAGLQRIVDFLGIEFQVTGYRSLVQQRPSQPSPDARRAFEGLRARLEPYLAFCSYGAEP